MTNGAGVNPGTRISNEAITAAGRVLHEIDCGCGDYTGGPGEEDREYDDRAARVLAAAAPFIEAAVEGRLREEALKCAANAVHVEARWQEELLQHGVAADRAAFVERLLILERVLIDTANAAAGVDRENTEQPTGKRWSPTDEGMVQEHISAAARFIAEGDEDELLCVHGKPFAEHDDCPDEVGDTGQVDEPQCVVPFDEGKWSHTGPCRYAGQADADV